MRDGAPVIVYLLLWMLGSPGTQLAPFIDQFDASAPVPMIAKCHHDRHARISILLSGFEIRFATFDRPFSGESRHVHFEQITTR